MITRFYAIASNGHLTVPHEDLQPHILVEYIKNYSKDMIVDMPRENMSKNYGSYLQLDRNSIIFL